MRSATEPEGRRQRRSSSRRFWLIAAGISAIIVVGIAVSYGAFLDYVREDPGYCGLCHVTQAQYALWADSAHQDLVCQRCHHETQEESLRMLAAYVFEGVDPNERAHGDGTHEEPVGIDSCGGCHMSHDESWLQVGGSAGHRVHIDSGKVDCLDCHARSIHRFEAALDSCGDCHEEHVSGATKMERLHCLACHNFMTIDDRDAPLRPSRKVCLECHAASGVITPAWPPGAPMAKLDCGSCHRPHAKEPGPAVACANCHPHIERHGLHGLEEHGDCSDCHETHVWMPTVARCLACHDDATDHSEGKRCWSCHDMKLAEPADSGDEAP